jgi:tRNA-dihydrouridine synthase B
MKFPFRNKYLLAPMEEINDIAFRILCKKSGCGLTYTGMINPLTKQKIFLDDKPGLQLFCNETKGIKEFIKKHDKKVFLWDFNLGCPAKIAQKNKIGAYLSDLKKIENILKEMRESTKKILTVKIRKSRISYNILKIAEKYCDAICIHPRTKDQGYSGKPDLEFAKKFKEKSKIPVIYSGDVNEKNADNFLKFFDYVMIGREAIGHPEIFSKLIKNKNTKNIQFKDYLKLAKKYKLPFRQIKLQAMNFTKGKKQATKLRLEIFKTRDIKDLENLLNI